MIESIEFIFRLLPQTDENILSIGSTSDDSKSLGGSDETKSSFSVIELMYAFARQKRKLNSISLFKS